MGRCVRSGHPVDILRRAYVSSCEDTKIQTVVQRAFILRRTRYRGGPGTARNARSRLRASRGRKRLRASIAPPRARYAPRPATYINNGREYSESEDTLLLPSESEALSDAMVVRRPEGVSGSVAMAIRWDRCHGGAAWNIHPPASFPRFPLLPASLPRPSLPSLPSSLPPSLRPPLFLSVSPFSTLGHRSHRSRFSPPYTYVFTRPPSLPSPDHLPHRPCRPFRLFCSQADSLSTEATVAGFGLSSFPSFSDI